MIINKIYLQIFNYYIIKVLFLILIGTSLIKIKLN